MNINIICVGKIKENYLKIGINEYFKRLSKYCRVNIFELQDERIPERPTKRELEIIQQSEAARIKSALKTGWFTIALDTRGHMFTSEELASKIENLGICGQSSLAFIIGGSTGLSPEIRNSSNLIISFSNLTFPHQLIRLFLLEQIFRSFKIIRGETYHK